MKDVYKDYFLIGTASGNSRMTGDKLDLIKYHFNAFTPENEMKPVSVQNVKGVFTYSTLDEQFAKLPGFNLIGHTLAWHSQSPSWMWGAPTPLSAAEAKANMDAHIESVLGRYGASLYSMDVVNEAMADGRNNADWRLNLRDNEGWYLALGSEWVEDAFLKAAEIVDANGWNCKLYYNDYNLDYADKATAVYNMVKDINERYAGRRPDGKPLIEGIGMQGHYNENTNAANVENSINLFSTLPGVSISVTELDITYQNSGSLTEEQAKNQAVKYAQLFDLYKRNAAGPANGGKGRIERITFWGTNDADSWRAAGLPLLFDRNLRAKEAFKAVQDPEAYLGATIPPAGLNYDQYPALKNVYKNYFMIGTVGPLTDPLSGLIDYHFNAYTPENEMKPQSVQNVKDTFTFDSLNNLLSGVTALPGDMDLIGHTLTWHSQSPNWMWDASPARYGQPGTFDRDTALANLNAHIDRVLGEYGGQLHSIDVVNEAVGTANPTNWKASLEKGEGWCLALGWEWVELAFVRAAKVVDENGWDCKLYYNDIGLDSAAKAQTVYEMVKDINKRYEGLRPNGKPLIEGIGMQGHYNKNTKPENVENSIKLFATLTGVSLSFTELDLEWLNTGSLTPEQAVAQGQKYAQLFQVFKKYAAGSANQTDNPKVIERVTFWGSNDGNSWKSTGFPLLFNAPSGAEVTAKEALVAVLNPDKYLEDNPVTDVPDDEEEKPIPGIYVYDTSKGDSWSGANIILGNDAGKWPWSTAGADGKAAFTPEKDATYRITVNYTSLGTNAIRIRWIKDESNNGYTAQDAQVVGASPSLNPSQVATSIPVYFNQGMSTGNSYALVTEIKLDGSQPADGLIGNIAIRGGAGGNAFSITGIKVEKLDTGGTPDRLLVNWPDGLPKVGIEGVHAYSTNNGDSWSGANIILGNDAGKWPWSTAGADGKVAFTPEKDATYRISVNYTSMGTSAIRIRWLRDESNNGYTAQDAQVVGASPSLGPSQVAAQIPVYFNQGMVSGGTYTLTSEVKLDGSQPADGLVGNIAIRGGSGGNSFLINRIKVEKIGTGGTPDKLLVDWPEGFDQEPGPDEPGIVIPPAGQTYEKYPALKDVYKDYFTMGIFGAGEINALIHNFAAYAPGNEMKPESTQSVKGTFTYTSADNAFSNLTARNPDMLFYGHTLAWHSQSPTWMWDAPPARYGQPGTFDRASALANLNNHIENVLGYYGGRLEGIDVVNEAVGTANPSDWKASLAKGEGWYNALGWEWVELAFLKAAEVVDSHPDWDCKLIYNDFGLDNSNKARVVYEMVKDINERYAGRRPNGKPLIEVIGMQEHDSLTTDAANVENSIKLFATLPGVKVNITEMDIGCPPVGTLTPDNENNQAMKYAELFQIFKKYASGPANKTGNPKVIDRVSICGVRDATTGWRAGEFALLFTSSGLAKQALVAVLDPDTFIDSHDYIEPEPEPETKPVDGVHVYSTANGDAWTGANIILGNDASKWPWSTADADGKVAFTPEKEATYRLTFNYTSAGTSAIRVRWVKDNTNGAYTTADGVVVNSHPYSATQVATAIPAYFNSGMVNGGSYTLTTEIKLDGSQPADGLIGNIAIRGGGGGNAFAINWLTIEKVEAGGSTMLVKWPAPTTIGYTVTANGAANATTTTSAALVFEKPVPGLTADDIAITAGTSNAVKGALTVVEGSNNTQYNLAISGVTTEGAIKLKITKDGVDDSVKAVDIHKAPATFSVTNIGGTAFVRDSTGIRLTFNAAVPDLLSDNIILSTGTPAAISNYATSTADKGALTKVSDTVYELALTGITRTGTLGVQVNKPGIETNKKNVIVNAKVDKTALQPTPPRSYFPQNITNLPKSAGLPDLFKFLDPTAGTKGRVVTKADWQERRDELRDLIQYYYYGRKYPTPKNAITVNSQTNQVNVTIADNGNTVTASLGTVTVPSGTAPEGGWPVIIAFGFGQTTMATQNGYAVINVSNWGTSRSGNYYKLYPFNPYEYDFNTGSIMTAAWTVSRVIDAMEISSEANGGKNQWNINPYKSITTGVSINGKYALMAAAMDDRVGAAAPVDCGQSGASSFRYIAEGKLFYYNSPIDRVFRRNQKGLNSIQYSGESFWMGLGTAAGFHQQTDMDYLPFDAHAVEALVAPRPLIDFANDSMDWTTPPSSVMAMSAAKEVYDFLGSDNIAVRVRDGAHAIQDRDVPFIIAIMDKEFSGKPLEVRNLYPSSNPPSYGTGTYNKISDMTIYPYDIDSSFIRWSRPGEYTLWTENEIVTEGIPATIKVHSDAQMVKLTLLDANNKPTSSTWLANVVGGTAVFKLTAKQVKVGRYEIKTVGFFKDNKTVYFQGVDIATALRHGTARNDNGAAVMYGFTSKINKDLVQVFADGSRLTQSLQEDTEQAWILNYGVTTNPNENNRIANNAFNVITLKKLQMEAMPGYTFELSIDKSKLAGNQETVSWNASAAVQKIGPQPSWPPYPNSSTDDGTRPLRPATTTNFSATTTFSLNDLVNLVPGGKLDITFSEPMNRGDFGVGFDFSDDFSLVWAEDNRSIEVTFNNITKGKGEVCNIYIMRLRDAAGNLIAAPIQHSFTLMPAPEYLITVTGVRPGFELGLASYNWVSAPKTTTGDTVIFAVPDKYLTYRLSLCQTSKSGSGNAYEPIILDVRPGKTVDLGKYFYDLTIPEGYSNVGITCMDKRWCVYQAKAGDTVTLLKTGQRATIVCTYENKEYSATIKLNGSNPFTTIVSAVPKASVRKLTGNKNEITITVTEINAVGVKKIYTGTFTGINNSGGIYNVGPYRVYVETKGNIQIRECYILK